MFLALERFHQLQYSSLKQLAALLDVFLPVAGNSVVRLALQPEWVQGPVCSGFRFRAFVLCTHHVDSD